MVQKLKIFKNRSNSNVKVMKSNIFVPKKRSSSIPYIGEFFASGNFGENDTFEGVLNFH